ncbi:MAG: SDR family NAD(P)-dependent oxidoreductase [Alphaproteobacteria bacterium]|nr:SDR family NAD(P)-dependent oxidoreductase [Alphaproteobacteria bacterium]
MFAGEGRGRRALVTGASAGIGAAFARLLGALGHDLVLTGRRAGRLHLLADELRGEHAVDVRVVAADLADPAAPAAILEGAGGTGAVDVLVNNAGYGINADFADTDWRAQADFIQVMVTAPMALTHACLGPMREKGFGRIIQVASLAGLLPGGAGHTLYAASKAFLIKSAQSLALECEGTGVHVSALCPGFTRSEFHDVNGARAEVERLPGFLWQSAERVAELGYEAVQAGRPVCVTGGVNRSIAALARLLPEGLGHDIARRRTRPRPKG